MQAVLFVIIIIRMAIFRKHGIVNINKTKVVVFFFYIVGNQIIQLYDIIVNLPSGDAWFYRNIISRYSREMQMQ